MAPCPSCGRENPDEARFCNACAAPLFAGEIGVGAAREQRKVVTVLFCDLVGSTALGESTDPEALRGRMRRYFEDLRAIIERHGGTVEKFVGDAVMAVFGIPVSHEDDAFRAVRAASEMRTAIAAHGLEARIGINTGDVVVGGDGETLVTGDAVNVAARLEQAAVPTETLIGAETRLLVRDAVKVEAVEPLALKGKSALVEAFRLLEVSDDADPLVRRLETTLVGRDRERRRLFRDYEDAVADRTCRLFWLLGPPGSGNRASSRTSSSAWATGRRPSWAVPLVRRGNHVLAAGGNADRDRRRARLRHRYVAAGDPACLSAVARSRAPQSGRRSS